jgi:hypothetical protein
MVIQASSTASNPPPKRTNCRGVTPCGRNCQRIGSSKAHRPAKTTAKRTPPLTDAAKAGKYDHGQMGSITTFMSVPWRPRSATVLSR